MLTKVVFFRFKVIILSTDR